MALRLLEAIVPGSKPEGLLKILEGQNLPCLWTTTLEDGNTLLHVLLPSEQTEHISDVLTGYYSDAPDCFKVIILPVEFALPKPGRSYGGFTCSLHGWAWHPDRISVEQLGELFQLFQQLPLSLLFQLFTVSRIRFRRRI